MRKRVLRLRENRYIVQIATLMSGTLMAQVIMLGFIPILTRLYTPSEFGIYSLFLAIASMIGMVSSWRYDQAIMLPKSDRDAQALLFLSMIITITMAMIVAVVLIVFYDFFLDYFQGISYLLWLLPLAVMILGMVQIFDAYSTRKEFYKRIATTKVSSAGISVTLQSLSRYGFNLNGLVIGKVMAEFVSLFLLLSFHLKKQTLQLKNFSKRRIQANMKRHEDFPKYQSVATLLNSFSQNIPILLFSSLFSPAMVGFYTLTYRVMQAPVMLIAGTTRSVFYQKASALYANKQSIYPLYKKTTIGLIKLFAVPFVVVLLFGRELFIFVFGVQWEMSGVIAEVGILMFLFAFITPPSVVSFNILNLQKVYLKFQIAVLFMRIVAIYGGYYLYHSYLISLIAFVMVGVLHNILFMSYIKEKIQKG
jgi:O-antigen/teichoic acid export membrane protein